MQRWSTFKKAVRVVAWIDRFCRNSRCSRQYRLSGGLTCDELEAGERLLLRDIQADSFAPEVSCLQAGQPLSRRSSILKLTPMLDDNGILRVKGRVHESDLSYAARHPVIVPKGHLATILARDRHELKHAGVDSVLTDLRKSFWLIGGRCIVKGVKKSCVACQRQDSSPISAPSGPLPANQVRAALPFSCIGVDFAGPLFCSDAPGIKQYILLFTCAVTRAVHLELTASLSAEAALMAFRRFCARRLCPSVVYSDNAKTFVCVAEMLAESLGSRAPQWKFIPPRAPWWGGFWERMVRTVKASLKKCLGSRCLSRTELETVLLEIESCVNSRPITFVGDCVDAVEPLTPSQFLHGVGRAPEPVKILETSLVKT